jgi:hypothetical protein
MKKALGFVWAVHIWVIGEDARGEFCHGYHHPLDYQTHSPPICSNENASRGCRNWFSGASPTTRPLRPFIPSQGPDHVSSLSCSSHALCPAIKRTRLMATANGRTTSISSESRDYVADEQWLMAGKLCLAALGRSYSLDRPHQPRLMLMMTSYNGAGCALN